MVVTMKLFQKICAMRPEFSQRDQLLLQIVINCIMYQRIRSTPFGYEAEEADVVPSITL